MKNTFYWASEYQDEDCWKALEKRTRNAEKRGRIVNGSIHFVKNGFWFIDNRNRRHDVIIYSDTVYN